MSPVSKDNKNQKILWNYGITYFISVKENSIMQQNPEFDEMFFLLFKIDKLNFEYKKYKAIKCHFDARLRTRSVLFNCRLFKDSAVIPFEAAFI